MIFPKQKNRTNNIFEIILEDAVYKLPISKDEIIEIIREEYGVIKKEEIENTLIDVVMGSKKIITPSFKIIEPNIKKAFNNWSMVVKYAVENGFEEDVKIIVPNWFDYSLGANKIKQSTKLLLESMDMTEKDFKIKLKFKTKNKDVNFRRIEFLGDSLVRLILTQYYIDKGYQRKFISMIVNDSVSNYILGIAGKNANLKAPKDMYDNDDKYYGSAFEYEIGRLLKEDGYDKAFQFVEKWLIPVIEK